MKKVSYLFLILLFVAGCGTSAPSETTNDIANDVVADQVQSSGKHEPSVNPKYLIGEQEDTAVEEVVVEPESTTLVCQDQGCFDQKFVVCEPATFIIESSLGSVSYNIDGPVEGGCEVDFVYIANPNPTWENQPMTCTLDNTGDFQAAFQKTFGEIVSGGTSCTGPLVEILQAL